MSEEDDLITIVDVTDPDDPSYSDVKTRRRYLTEQELSNLKPMLEKVGAYKFFSAEFNFADGPAVKQFIESVELEEFKRSKQRKIVQDKMKGTVAGREVVIDSDLIEKAFGLVDDGEDVIKPKGETHGLHAFYIKQKYIHLCQNYRGVYLKLFKSEYNYFVNMAHQIQTYCCGGTAESQITLTQYRAIDLMVRGKPVNWNRYLMQNFQDKLRKYKTGPCSLYFGGTLTALIYKALHVDYNLVNKPLLIPPQTPERLALTDGDKSGKSSGKKNTNAKKNAQKLIKAPPKKKEMVKREVGAMTRAQRMLSPSPECFELELPRTKKSTAAALKALKRKRERERAEKAAAAKKQKSSSGKPKRIESGKQQKRAASEAEEEEEESDMQNEETEDDMPASPAVSMPPSPLLAKSPATAPPAYKTQKTPATPLNTATVTHETPATAPPPYVFTPETTPYTEGGIRKRVANVEKLGGEIVLATATNRLSRLFAYANGSGRDDDEVSLTESEDLWHKYDQLFTLQHEQQLEHIVSKKMLERSLQKVQELEDLLKNRDEELDDLKSQLSELRSESRQVSGEQQQAPLKIRLKVGQKKMSAQSNGNGEVAMETDARRTGEAEEAAEDEAKKKKSLGVQEQVSAVEEDEQRKKAEEKTAPASEVKNTTTDQEMAESDGKDDPKEPAPQASGK